MDALNDRVILFIGLLFSLTIHAADGPPDEMQSSIETTRAISADIDNYLTGLVKTEDARPISQGLVRIIQTYPFVDFYFLENRLRKLNTNIYLVAAPARLAPEETCVRSLMPHQEDGLPFFLWVGVHGRDEMLTQLEEFGIANEAQNLQNLLHTGLLSPKPTKH